MQCHVRKLGHLEITIHDLQTYSEQKKIRKLVMNKKNNKKTIKSHKIKNYFKIQKQEKKKVPYLIFVGMFNFLGLNLESM